MIKETLLDHTVCGTLVRIFGYIDGNLLSAEDKDKTAIFDGMIIF